MGSREGTMALLMDIEVVSVISIAINNVHRNGLLLLIMISAAIVAG